MKTIKYAVLLAAFLPLKSMASADSTAKSYFYVAKQHLESMLSGKEQMSYEEAIYQIENAWWQGGIDKASYKASLDAHTAEILNFAVAYRDSIKLNPVRDLLETKEQKIEKYKKALVNQAIYSHITDTLVFLRGNQLAARQPFTYSTKDPFGTTDWTNTQVVHLLNKDNGNCFALASLFKIFSERLASDANLCTAPGHIYIRHADDKGTRFNVELSSKHAFPGTGTLETLTYTPDEATKKGIALRELDIKQSVALCLVYLAKGYEYKFGIKDDPFMLACAETALQYDDHNLNAMLLKAEVMENGLVKQNKTIVQLGNEKAFQDYQNWIGHIFSYGYREMPFEMKNIMIKGWTRDTIVTLSQQDHTPSRLKHATLKDTRYAGLSWGLFDEEIKTKPLERYSNTVFDTKKMKVVAFLKSDVLYNQYNFDPVVFAWNIDPLAHMYPSISPYAFCANSPIAICDLDGRVLVFKGNGADVDRAVTQMQSAVGDFYTVARNKKGVVTVVANPSAVGSPSIKQQTAAQVFMKVADPNGKKTTIGIVKNSDKVNVGNFETSQIDIGDVQKYDNIKNTSGSPTVYSGSGKMIHEIEEQYQKQALGETSYPKAHKQGILQENAYNGSTRATNGTGEQYNISQLKVGIPYEEMTETVTASDGKQVKVTQSYDVTNLPQAQQGATLQENLNSVKQTAP
ncbi:MAG: hypothetical protein BGO69_12780 [Bacteroidetes bacterium 46-16]|nr:MAG: hypothetical protein BGO69_12780 [Bacteroidetes bacterium 46-16]